ncbi:MAG: sensor histidine kinase [Anaerobacillus sp.]|uniref:sensor histidine kinase n=1 Tax=Anaerobacillus sp. TaxID=1872506 RepID=UPI00391BB6F5
MLRNQEFNKLLLTMSGISLLSILLVSYFSVQAAVIVTITNLLLIAVTVVYTNWRYRDIDRLSSYLRQISSGDFTLDVRDNREGELSILKNEIYKVTLKLSEHSDLLQKDKIKLTNAISDISHQLKTPITSMVVMSDLLNDARLTEDKRSEFNRNIRVQLERIEWLVASLLKLSKIDAGTIQFKKDKVLVKDLIQKAVHPLLIPIDIKEQTLELEGNETVSFVGDLNWTSEALINIIKNCLEHTPNKGTIRIHFSENSLFTEVVIKDNGKGIAKEDLPYIFKRFYKGKNANEESVGIGLAMAHSIITSQNGTIQVDSMSGQGTTFQLKFYKQII